MVCVLYVLYVCTYRWFGGVQSDWDPAKPSSNLCSSSAVLSALNAAVSLMIHERARVGSTFTTVFSSFYLELGSGTCLEPLKLCLSLSSTAVPYSTNFRSCSATFPYPLLPIWSISTT